MQKFNKTSLDSIKVIILFFILATVVGNDKPASAQVAPFLLWSRLHDSTYFSLNRYWVQDDDPMASVTDELGNTYVDIHGNEITSITLPKYSGNILTPIS